MPEILRCATNKGELGHVISVFGGMLFVDLCAGVFAAANHVSDVSPKFEAVMIRGGGESFEISG